MKTLKNAVLGSALVLFTGALMAQSNGQSHGGPRYNAPHSSPDNRGGPGMYASGRKAGWYRTGGRVPQNFRGSSYVVSDWRGNRLRQPPRGYRWVRSDNGDFLLIGVSSGIISSILARR